MNIGKMNEWFMPKRWRRLCITSCHYRTWIWKCHRIDKSTLDMTFLKLTFMKFVFKIWWIVVVLFLPINHQFEKCKSWKLPLYLLRQNDSPYQQDNKQTNICRVLIIFKCSPQSSDKANQKGGVRAATVLVRQFMIK